MQQDVHRIMLKKLSCKTSRFIFYLTMLKKLCIHFGKTVEDR